MGVADRINQLLADPEAGLDRLLAVIASLDTSRPGFEDSGVKLEDLVAAKFDEMAQGCPDPGDPAALFAHVYGPLGFTGNLTDYYNPANSLIDKVLKRRRGIPLSLAVVVSEMSRRHGRDLRPVGLPGHVLLGEGAEPSRWFDPFNRGVALGVDDCRSLFGRIHPIESFDHDMLRPMTGLEVIIRTLNNLRIAYAKQGDIAKMIPVLELRVDLPPVQVGDRRELADLLAGLGRFDQAGDQYEILAEHDPENREAHEARYQACRVHQN